MDNEEDLYEDDEGDYSSNEREYRSNEGEYGPNEEDYGRNEEEYEHNGRNYGCSERRYGRNYEEDANLQSMLEQKDRDLMLAAELGKALLEKNSDLEKKIEQAADEYNQSVETLEQERHGLHLKLENLEGEYENTVKELQYDMVQLREELERVKHESFTSEKDNLHKIQELTQQNERLLEELQHVRRREHQYESELRDIRASGLANISAKQACQIEHLQEQISALTVQNADVERCYMKISEERESLLSVIEETQDRIEILERQKVEQDLQLHQKDAEIRDHLDLNSRLNVQIDHLTEKASNSSGHSMTLFTELSQLPGNQDISMTTSSPSNPYPPSMLGDDDIECDDDDYLMTSPSPVRFGDTAEALCERQDSEMEEEIVHAYKHLRQICREIKVQMGDKVADNTDDDEKSSFSDESGSLNDVVVELRDTIHSAMQQSNQTQTTHLSEIHSLQQRVSELERDLIECQSNMHKLGEQLQIRDVHLQQKSYKITELSRQVTAQHEDIKILSTQRDKLQNMLASDTAKPQMYSAMALLRHARRERDAAIERRYSTEKELQQSKYEIIVLNHQLMEAIHQKNKVSQLLDQWQSDMANLLGVQVEDGMKPSLSISGVQTDTGTKPLNLDGAQIDMGTKPLNFGGPQQDTGTKPLTLDGAQMDPRKKPLHIGSAHINTETKPLTLGCVQMNAGTKPLNIGGSPMGPGMKSLNLSSSQMEACIKLSKKQKGSNEETKQNNEKQLEESVT